jgi:hypothetical protein
MIAISTKNQKNELKNDWEKKNVFLGVPIRY